ncbi:hypothetical protein TrST_g9046 [Triparma strigata]|uniref:Prolyl 4-hydroxylase alpha subunit Fe(2+) 2OG dioxygenase domain-containing protein n=1 Tax=Triparma strigata TaxID=1606541 RepID=A0A9W6ZQJ3_9STRA|nr:hypothetical protein TrST_g9046 [Triparma strigata]
MRHLALLLLVVTSSKNFASPITETSSKLLWSTLISVFEVNTPGLRDPLISAALDSYENFALDENSEASKGDQYYQSQILGDKNRNNKVFSQNSAFEQLKEETMATAFAHVLKEFFNEQPSRAQLGGIFCWATVGGGGEQPTWHSPHTHQNSVLSAVYYAAVPDDGSGAPITFSDPRGPWTNLKHSHQPVNNTIVVFPSWLEHFIPPTNSPQYRISYSCNLPGSFKTTTDLNIEL